MASNFRIYVQRNSKDFHIKLEGDFDGTSAHQLLNVMKENQRGVTKIFIDTSLLDCFHHARSPFTPSSLQGLKSILVQDAVLKSIADQFQLSPWRSSCFFDSGVNRY